MKIGIKRICGGGIGLIMALAVPCVSAPADYAQAMKEAWGLHQKDYQAAIKLYQTAMTLAENYGQKARARWGLGLTLMLSGAADEGRAILEELLKGNVLNPDDQAAAWEAIGDGWLAARHYAEAVKTYGAIANVEHASAGYKARGLVKRGAAEYARGDYAAARAAWEEAVALKNTSPVHLREAWPGIGDTYMAEGKWDEARLAYERAAAATADSNIKAKALIGAGNAAYAAGDYPAAAKIYLDMLADDQLRGWDGPRLVLSQRLDTIFRMQLQKADDLLVAGKYSEARAEYAKAFDMEQVEDHHKAAAQLGMGKCLEAEKKSAEARAEYAKVLAMPGAHWPDKGRAQMGVARCWETEGNKAEALKAYEGLLKMKNVSRFDMAEAEAKLR